jgi:hypothetical protein
MTVPPQMRLAFRQEGENWCVYLANPDNMEDALLMASIRMSIVTQSERHKRAFMDLMKAILDDTIKDRVGVRADSWIEREAPEHERSRE